MEDRADGRQAERLDLAESIHDVRVDGHVRTHNLDAHVGRVGHQVVDVRVLAHPLNRALALRVAIEHKDVLGAHGDHVRKEAQPKVSQASREEDSARLAVLADAVQATRVANLDGLVRGRRREHNLALVQAAHHGAESGLMLRVLEARDGQAGHLPFLDELEAALGELSRQHRVVHHQTVNVDRAVREVLAEDGHLERSVRVDVHLADLAVPAACRERLEAEVDMLARQRVENDVDTLALRELHHVRVPRGCVRVKGSHTAHRHQLLAARLGARGADDVGARVLGERDGRLPHASHGRVHEDGLALAHAREVDE